MCKKKDFGFGKKHKAPGVIRRRKTLKGEEKKRQKEKIK